MFTFSEMLALVESESSFEFGAYVCHGGLGAPERLAILYPTVRSDTEERVAEERLA